MPYLLKSFACEGRDGNLDPSEHGSWKLGKGILSSAAKRRKTHEGQRSLTQQHGSTVREPKSMHLTVFAEVPKGIELELPLQFQ